MTISAHSTGQGAGEPTCSQLEFPVSQPVEPGGREARRMTAGSGRRLCASFGKFDPLGRCSRILLESEMWASPEFLLTWKLKTTKCGCLVYQLAPLAPRTGGNATGLCAVTWPTPDASTAGKTSRGGDRIDEPLIGGLVRSTWPTPASRDVKGQSQHPERMDYVPNVLKATWPTPQAYDGKRGGPQGMVKSKAGNHEQKLQDWIHSSGSAPSGCLARTEKFAVRLTTLSAWLMGYTAQYLELWETQSCRRSRRES